MKLGLTRLSALAAALGTTLTVALAACGTDPGESFDEDAGNGTSGASGASGNNGFTSGGNGASSGNGTSGDLGDGAACEAANSRAEKLPLTMLIALDQSGSMANYEPGGYTNLETRWKPVTAALRVFWSNPLSAGITANMRLFPHNNTKSESCKNPAYTTPDVALTPLPNVDPFNAVLSANPQTGFTPTRAVLHGMVAEAQALRAADPETQVVLLLVTDGEPLQCGDNDPNNDIDGACAEVAGKGIPMYVIGLGEDSLKPNLTALANAGGTGVGDGGDGIGPIFVETGNPAATEAAFTTALDRIRNKLASCDVNIPAPPAGKTFDRNKVNVTLTSGGGTATDLTYDPTCAGAGWKYDNADAPTKILLCPATCEPVKADPSSKIDVAFGCETRGGGVH